MLNKQSRNADKGWSYSLGFGRGANNSSLKTVMVTKSALGLDRPLGQLKQF